MDMGIFTHRTHSGVLIGIKKKGPKKKERQPMNEEKVLMTLDELMQLDMNAVQAYDQAIGSITDTVIRERLQEFKARHADQAKQLGDEIIKMVSGIMARHWDS